MSRIVHRKLSSVDPISSPCGPLRVLTTSEDTPIGNVVVLRAHSESHAHYHRVTTEFYYVTQGFGEIFVGETSISVNPGSCVVIPPGEKHHVRPYPNSTLEIVVFATPAWREDDEFLVGDNPDEQKDDPFSPELGGSE